VRAKDIKPGVVYGQQRGRSEYADIRAVVFLAPVDGDHLYATTSHHRKKGEPAFEKRRPGSKPSRGRGWSAPDVGYPVVYGPPAKIGTITLADFEAATSTYYDHGSGIEFRVLTSLTSIVGTYEEAVAAQKKQQAAARQEQEREEREREAALGKARALIAALKAAGVRADVDHAWRPQAVTIPLAEADKLLALLPAETSKED
jgi:hypothetical protein